MKPLLFFFSFLLLIACSGNSISNENCNFLLNVNVRATINLNLPQYSELQFVSNSVYIPNQGNGGIIVTNAGSGYFAWDASDPNHTPSSSSILKISGLEATCSCGNNNTYSLINGQPLGDSSLLCGLKNYRVDVSGNTLFITN